MCELGAQMPDDTGDAKSQHVGAHGFPILALVGRELRQQGSGDEPGREVPGCCADEPPDPAERSRRQRPAKLGRVEGEGRNQRRVVEGEAEGHAGPERGADNVDGAHAISGDLRCRSIGPLLKLGGWRAVGQ
jgi:hypothetical protein